MRKALPSISIAFLIGFMGLLPHLVFSLQMGELSYFKSAYDEDTYLNFLIRNGPVVPYRLIANLLLETIHFITHGNAELTLILTDFCFPFLCALSAGYLAYNITQSLWKRILLILCLLFGQEFLSLGSSAIWNFESGVWNLRHLRSQFAPWGSIIIPDYYTSYFSIFRTPEPQVSWIILFLYLGFLTKYFANEKKNLTHWHLCVLLSLNTCFSFSYIFISVPLLILEFLLVFTFWYRKRKKKALYIGLSFLWAIVLYLTVWPFLLNSIPPGRSLVFSSHLPIVTPSVLFSMIVITLLLITQKSRILESSRLILSFISLSIPLFLMEQQVVTGIMVSTRDWERNINYPLLVFGSALFLSLIKKPSKTPALSIVLQRSVIVLVFFLSYLLYTGQKQVFRSWYSQNETALAMKWAVLGIENSTVKKTRLLLEEPGLAPLLSVKINRPIDFVIDYSHLFNHPISDMPIDGGLPSKNVTHQEHLFEFFARTNRTPLEVSSLLKKEALQRSGYYLGFLFSLRDYWYPATDNRLVRQRDILKNIDKIVEMYKAYLKAPHNNWLQPVILLTNKSPDEIQIKSIWNNVLISKGCTRNMTIYAYSQRPISF